MKQLEPGSVDMVLCDLPYGITSNKWDSVLPLPELWSNYSRLCRGRIVLTASQPFTSVVVVSHLEKFKHSWTWIKGAPTGFQNAKKMPLRDTEDVLVFCEGPYNPQGLFRINKTVRNGRTVGGGNVRGDIEHSIGKGKLRTPGSTYIQEFTGYPKNILEFRRDDSKLHPTQKPVALFEYLILTYTNFNDVVLDTCIGSGTTAIACLNTGRDFIGMELNSEYVAVANKRLDDWVPLF
jgi:site-specific DNA-methyltransferase (adenine-specific)